MLDDNLLEYRNIEKRDEGRLLNLRNSPSNLKFFKNPNPVSADDHARWFASRLTDFEELQIVAVLANELVGIIFIVPQADQSCSISINVDSQFQSQGIGRGLLLRMLSRAASLQFSRIEAFIHISNIKSIYLFESFGFLYEEDVSELFSRYVKLIDKKI